VLRELEYPLVYDLEDEWLGEVNRRSRDYIRWVQRSLNRIIGSGLAVDGIRGPRTRRAIRHFQRQRGLGVDGIVGPRTEAALIAAGASPPAGRQPVRPGRARPGLICGPVIETLDKFQVGDYRLRPHHYEKLIRIAPRLIGRVVQITGHTDSQGAEVMNAGLSLNRAAEVQRFLAAVGIGRTIIRGAGETRPIASNATSDGRRRNRRVELRLCRRPPRPPLIA
jgi:hypothetical protein